MNHMGSPPFIPADHSFTKRKRSLSGDEPHRQPTPPAKVPKTNANHLQINYLARQYQEILPLISPEDALPSLLSLISDYDGVLHRHESMAGNLGARPLGPILIQRFERLFDGPPHVLKTHGKEGTSVGWLDVVDFARNKPEQFNLEKMREGNRVCQFYTKQCRVEISEEDYVLIKSGMPEKLIPPQPIGEDEEKELGTLEILEKNLGGVVQLADQVSARARQLNHRLKNRKNAILARREAEVVAVEGARSPSIRGFDLGQPRYHTNHSSNGGNSRSSTSPKSGFIAVNSRYQLPSDRPSQHNGSSHEYPRIATQPLTNGGSPMNGASAATRAELLNKFHTSSDRSSSEFEAARRSSLVNSRPSVPPKPKNSFKPYADSMEYAGALLSAASPVPIPNTPASLLPYVKPSPTDRFEDSGPYKADMMARMEQLNRGDRVQPPCDRCRRLHMDCLKNLTACMGCTKKHAKCSWKDVEEQELKDHPFVLRIRKEDDGNSEGDGSRSGRDGSRKRQYSQERGVRDEELLGEDTGDEEGDTVEKPAQARRYSSVQPISPPALPVAKEPIPETKDGLLHRVQASPAITSQSTMIETRDETTNLDGFRGRATASPPKPPISDPDIDLIYSTSRDTAPALPTPAPSYQAPEANMHRYEANSVASYSDPKEGNIYTQLNTATHEDLPRPGQDEPLRVYTAGSDPVETAPTTGGDPQRLPEPQVSSSPTQAAMKQSRLDEHEEKREQPPPPMPRDTFQRPPSPMPNGTVPEMGVQRMGMQA